MAKMLGIVALENENVRVEGLMDYRPIPAISFLGRYRLIDFVVSNMTNSGMNHLKVFGRRQPRSLIEQLGDGRQYNINSKRGRLQLLFAENSGVTGLYDTDINAYLKNMEFIEEATEEYVLICPGYQVFSFDFNQMLEQHIESGADVTVLYKNVDDANVNFIGCPALTIEKGRIKDAEMNMGNRKSQAISMETYLMSRLLFMELVKEAHRISPIYSLRDILRSSLKTLRVNGYSYRGYFACINSLNQYFKTSMELIDYDVAKNLFKEDWPIYTKTNDSVPAFYGKTAKVEHCLIANGCRIEGTLENCVLGRGVVVEKDAVVRNSILMPNAVISKDTHINYAIVDKWAKINRIKEIHGNSFNLMYIRRRDQI